MADQCTTMKYFFQYVLMYPLYLQSNYTEIANACNFWRNFHDVDDSWDSIKKIIMHYGQNLDDFSAAAKPGAWNDPDMVCINNLNASDIHFETFTPDILVLRR